MTQPAQEKPEERSDTRGAPESGQLAKVFTISFVAFCLMPLIILFAIYLNADEGTADPFSKTQLGFIILVMGAVSLALFFMLKRSLTKLFVLSRNLRKALFGKVDMHLLIDLAEGEGEVAELARTIQEYISVSREEKFLKAGFLRQVSRLIVRVEESGDLFQQIVDLACRMTSSPVGFLITTGGDRWEFAYGKGLSDDVRSMLTDIVKGSQPESITAEGKVVNLKELAIPALGAEAGARTVRNVLGVWFTCSSLVDRKGFLGVISANGEQKFQAEQEWILSYIGQIVRVLSNVSETLQDYQRSCQDAFLALLRALEARDPSVFARSKTVNALCMKVAAKLGLSDRDREILGMASQLYDIGMLAVPDRILLKAESLSDREKTLMQEHVEMGVKILSGIPSMPAEVLDIVKAHHERYDGKGYPRGLKGDSVPLAARIIHVCQAYEAMTSQRPFRGGMKAEAVIEKMTQDAGQQFDPHVLSVFQEVIIR